MPLSAGKTERKVFATLPFSDGAPVNDGYPGWIRRSQNIAIGPRAELRTPASRSDPVGGFAFCARAACCA